MNYLVIGNVHALAVYFSYFKGVIPKTILFTTVSIPESLYDNFEKIIFIKKTPKNILLRCVFYSYKYIEYIPYIIKIIFNRNIMLYGIDSIYFSRFIFVKNYILIEDGLANYTAKYNYGRSLKCKKIILSGMKDIPQDLIDKVVIVPSRYDYLSLGKKIINNEKIKYLLLTQPLSEDGFIDEQEKIKLYLNIISKYNSSVFIKPHPREITDYTTIVENRYVLPSKDPIEILIDEYQVEYVITLFSGAIYNLTCKKHIYGTCGIYQIENKIGIIKGNICE